MTIVGRAGALSREVPVSLTIQVAPPPFSFQLFSTSFASVLPDGRTEFKLAAVLNSGIPESVNLSVEGLPPGATGTFFPNPVTPTGEGSQVTLTISTAPTTAPGTFSLTIVGRSGTLTREAEATLHVQGSDPWDFALQSSESRVVMSCDPGFGCEAYVDITATLVSGPAQPVILSVQGFPQEDFDIGFFPNPVTPTAGGARTTLAIATSPVPGTHRVTVVATSGTLTRTVSFDLIIQ
jgi:serine protease AprX